VSSKASEVFIQTSSQSVPSTPSWLGEVTVIAHYLEHLSVLSDISERVRFARRRFGQYDLFDFVVVLLGYAISGERTLEAFYERVLPFANTFMALFGREHLPHRSTLSRFLAALDQAPSKHYVRCFSKISWLVRWRNRRSQAGSGIDRATIGRCSMSMAHGKLLANEPSLARLIALQHNAD